MSKTSMLDYLTDEEKQLLHVLKTAVANAKSIAEIEEAKQSIANILLNIPKRIKHT